ncbi:MAG: ABC transporter permease [Firmicutes bacterium]|nr:ABC transporter permease [Bacillota bacterium]MCL5040211.1 ABC transporter permease [Bacillota bacterium]
MSGLLATVRIIWAIVKKDLLVMLRYPLNTFMMMVEPIMWLTPVYFLGRAFSSNSVARGFLATTGTGDFMTFVLLGTIAQSYISAAFWGMGMALRNDMTSGTLEANWLAPVSRLLLLFGKSVSSLVRTSLNLVVILALGNQLFGLEISAPFWKAGAYLLPMLIGLYGFGFAYAGLVLLLKDANVLTDVTNFLVSTLSGSSFPVKVLPTPLLMISLALPMTYGLDAIRSILLGIPPLVALGWESLILIIFALVFSLAGSYIFRRVDQHVRRTGTLSMY